MISRYLYTRRTKTKRKKSNYQDSPKRKEKLKEAGDYYYYYYYMKCVSFHSLNPRESLYRIDLMRIIR